MITTFQNRIDSPASIDTDYIDQEMKTGKHVIVQYPDATYTDKALAQLNELCKKYDEQFGLRFYGHYSGSFDFNALRKIPDVKCLYVDCLVKAHNVSVITELAHLKMFSLGVYEWQEPEILQADNLRKLNTLILTPTRSKALNLEYLKYYTGLKELILSEHTKNIDVLGQLSTLEWLSLNSIKKTDVRFINRLKKLKTLKFILGGRENLDEINENEIESLEIIRVRGFNDLGNISRFQNLKNLLIEDNIQFKKLAFDRVLPYFTDLQILNCKSFSSLAGLQHLPRLHKLRINRTKLDFEKTMSQKLPLSLKIIAFYTGKKKEDDALKLKLKERGYREW